MQRIFKMIAVFGIAVRIAIIPVTADAVEPQAFGRVDVAAAIANLPDTSENVLEEQRLIDNGSTGIRVFRVYKPVPRHHHKFSDSYLHILSGSAEVSIDGGAPFEANSGAVVFWRAGIDHEVTRIIKEPLIFLAVDSPVRRKGDVTFFAKSQPSSDNPEKW